MKTVAGEKGGRNRLTPFQEPRKRDHMSRSLRNSLPSQITEVGLERPRVRAIIRRRKGHPGATTLHAKWRDPISDCRSWRRQALLDCHDAISVRSLDSLLSGSRASIFWESSRMPMNSSSVEGQKVFPGARGMPGSVNRVRSSQRAVEHKERGGGKNNEKIV